MTTDTSTAMLRGALLPALGVAAVSVVVAGLWVGTEGVVGALIGAALVVVFFGLGLVVLGRFARVEPAVLLLIAMGLYAAKIVLIGGSLLLIQASGLLEGVAHDMALALTTIACTLAWSAGQIIGATRAREPVYDLDERGEVR